jgi:hypothetical protein
MFELVHMVPTRNDLQYTDPHCMFDHGSFRNGATRIPHRPSTLLQGRANPAAIRGYPIPLLRDQPMSSAQVVHHVHELPHASANANPCRRVAFTDGTWRGTSLNCCPHPAGGITIDRVHQFSVQQRARHIHIARCFFPHYLLFTHGVMARRESAKPAALTSTTALDFPTTAASTTRNPRRPSKHRLRALHI